MNIVDSARAWIGTPYRHQASMLGAGCDCLGLVRGVWREAVGEEPWIVPPYRRDAGGGLVAAAEVWLQPGDLAAGAVVLFRLHRSQPPRHCGIMVSYTRFVHAQERLGVVEADLSEAWRRRIARVFRFSEHWAAPRPALRATLSSEGRGEEG